jgi:hypothetical protein
VLVPENKSAIQLILCELEDYSVIWKSMMLFSHKVMFSINSSICAHPATDCCHGASL